MLGLKTPTELRAEAFADACDAVGASRKAFALAQEVITTWKEACRVGDELTQIWRDRALEAEAKLKALENGRQEQTG